MDAILTFHSIDRSGSVLSFPPEGLRRLLESLLESGVAIVPLRDLMDARSAPRHRVALTFDGAVASATSAERQAIAADYAIVLAGVGQCDRTPPPAPAPVPPRRR